MIDALEKLDNRTAAGLLARAALALENEGNPAASAQLDNEKAIRDAVLSEARSRLGLAPDDNRPSSVEKIGDFFDQESDQLIGPSDTTSALERLALRGDLASDLYQINIIPNIIDFLGKNFEDEKRLINLTVSGPGREQHYGPSKGGAEPSLISLFARRFRTPWPFKDFTMLVAGGRNKLVLEVHQAWRVYPAYVDDRGNDLVEVLRRFAEVYGISINIDGTLSSFFLSADRVLPKVVNINTHGRTKQVTVSQFIQRVNGVVRASLITAIDLDRYQATLDKMAVPYNQIV